MRPPLKISQLCPCWGMTVHLTQDLGLDKQTNKQKDIFLTRNGCKWGKKLVVEVGFHLMMYYYHIVKYCAWTRNSLTRPWPVSSSSYWSVALFWSPPSSWTKKYWTGRILSAGVRPGPQILWLLTDELKHIVARAARKLPIDIPIWNEFNIAGRR